MGMQTDVKALSLAASGAVTNARVRIRGLVVEPGASTGSVIIKDGGSSGTTLFTINTVANGETFSILIPAEGVLCSTSAYATLSNAKVTVFYA
jgi:hypothetical protein